MAKNKLYNVTASVTFGVSASSPKEAKQKMRDMVRSRIHQFHASRTDEVFSYTTKLIKDNILIINPRGL